MTEQLVSLCETCFCPACRFWTQRWTCWTASTMLTRMLVFECARALTGEALRASHFPWEAEAYHLTHCLGLDL